jgi:hypothetical protein
MGKVKVFLAKSENSPWSSFGTSRRPDEPIFMKKKKS